MRSLQQSVAAELIGENPPWLRNNIPPECRNEDGTYSGPRVIAYLLQQHGATREDKEAIKLAEIRARTERDTAQAERTRLATRREEAELIAVVDVQRAISTILAAYAEHFVGIADKLAPSFPANQRHELVAIIRADISRCLVGVSEELQRKVLPGASKVEEAES